MSSVATIRLPPALLYPEKSDHDPNWAERLIAMAATPVMALSSAGRRGRYMQAVRRVVSHGPRMAALGDKDIEAYASQLRRELVSGLEEAATARAFALIREISSCTLGMRHFDVQLLGGFAMLDGCIAEMETGEGKTLTATLPAATAALAGIPVHVVTVNDYLAQRDAELMKPVYHGLGLSVGVVVHGMTPAARRAAYGCDVTYCTNKELAFDYLRDRMVLSQKSGNVRLKLARASGQSHHLDRLVLRGLCFAIVDEADSVLIDEARTPLIITGAGDSEDERVRGEQALHLAGHLERDLDYSVRMDERRIELTSRGQARLEALGMPLMGMWSIAILREETVIQALTARYLFNRDEHYLVRDGKVQIVDEYTGRVMADRTWSEGLHQLIELKEGCEPSTRRITLARLTYQRFFRRYRRLAGMTGTAREITPELWSTYLLHVVTIPTNRPCRRIYFKDQIAATSERKWQLIRDRAAELQNTGRPVLIGTRSVAASQIVSRYLTMAGLEHQVLNATQDADEADIIRRAGAPGCITVATNMAGRGTDIKLAAGCGERGGLHVIITERHDAARIDRQLAGRCARQGDPGSVEAILSLEDALLAVGRNTVAGRALSVLGRIFGARLARASFRHAQRRAERVHFIMRRDLLKSDRKLETALAFSGRRE